MANIASAKQKLNDQEVDADAALSEALHEKIGGSINYLIDTTDDHETRIGVLESPTTAANTTTTTAGLTVGTLSTNSITPVGTKVLIIPGGQFLTNGVTGSGASIQLRKGGTPLYTHTLSSTQDNMSLPSFLDTSATSGASNTYSIYVSSVTGTVNATAHYVHLIDVK